MREISKINLLKFWPSTANCPLDRQNFLTQPSDHINQKFLNYTENPQLPGSLSTFPLPLLPQQWWSSVTVRGDRSRSRKILSTLRQICLPNIPYTPTHTLYPYPTCQTYHEIVTINVFHSTTLSQPGRECINCKYIYFTLTES